MERSDPVPQKRSRRRTFASWKAQRLQERGSVGFRTEPRSFVLPVFVAVFGLFLCIGFFGVIGPSHFRLVKHLFYALIGVLLVLDFPAVLRIARRDLWIWALLGLICASALWSEAPVWVIKRGLVTVQTTAFGLYIASRFSLDQQVRLFAWFFTTTVAVIILSVALDPATAFTTHSGVTVLTGPFSHKNTVGILMALAVTVLLLRATSRSAHRWPMWLGFAAAATVLVLSRSLTGTLVGLTLCVVIALAPFATRLRRPSLLLVPSIVVTTIAIAANSGLVDGLIAMLGKSPTLSGRTDLWRELLPLILERPLFGHSIVFFWQKEIYEQTNYWYGTAHNGYLQMLLELGAVGLVILFLQMISTIVCALRWQRLRGGRRAVWPLCMCSFMLLYNLSESILMRENSLVWVLYVAASFSVRDSVSRQTAPGR